MITTALDMSEVKRMPVSTTVCPTQIARPTRHAQISARNIARANAPRDPSPRDFAEPAGAPAVLSFAADRTVSTLITYAEQVLLPWSDATPSCHRSVAWSHRRAWPPLRSAGSPAPRSRADEIGRAHV